MKLREYALFCMCSVKYLISYEFMFNVYIMSKCSPNKKYYHYKLSHSDHKRMEKTKLKTPKIFWHLKLCVRVQTI